MSVSLSLCGYNRRILYLYKDERDEETISDYSQRGGVIYPIIKHDKTKTGKPLACFSWHNYLQKFYISVSLSKIGIFNVSQSKWESHSIPHHNNEVVKVLQSRPCSGNTIACGCESGKVYIWRIYSLPLFDKKKKMKMRYSRQTNQRNKPNRNRSLQKQKHKKRKNKNFQYLAMDSDEESNDDFTNCPKYEEMDDESDESNNNYEESDEEDEDEEEEDDEFALLKNKFFRKLEKESESEKENQLLAEFSHGKAEIYDLCWSPTGKYLAIATSKNLVIWDISRKKSEKIKQGKLGSKIALVKWSHSGRLLFIATNMKEIIVFNTINWESYCWNMNSNVTDACWDHNSQFIIISCRGETKLWILSFEQKQETKGEFVTSIDISKFLTLQNVSQYIYPTRNHKRKKRGKGERNRRKTKTLSKYEQSKMDFLKKQKEKQNQEIFNEKEIEIIQEDDDDEQEEEDDDRNNRNNILPSSDEESDEEYGAQYSEENENEIENEELNNKIDEQIEIRKVTIDPYGKRIAILFNPNSIVGNLIGLLSLGRRKQNRGYQFSWIGFFNTLPEHGLPKLIKFRKNHTRGALLATVWSSFIVKLFPLYFRK